MNTSSIIGIIVVVVIVIGGAWYFMTRGSAAPAAAPSQTAAVATTTGSTGAPPASGSAVPPAASASGSASASASAATPRAQSFTVNGNDATADLKTITVPAGTPVTITFGADSGTTYHGGLDFRSSVVNTGTITPGSTKTVSFVATKSFSFTPYWPSTNIAKPYTIDIVVQ